jgi:SOS-response transcriptional repressor LexA
MNALEIRGLTKEYKDFKLDSLDLTLPAGCIALVEPADEEVSGKLCLVELDDGERIVRRVHAGASNSMLSPESWTMRDDVTLGNDKLRVIGTIAWWMGGSAHVVS